jgi:hypothetical protein
MGIVRREPLTSTGKAIISLLLAIRWRNPATNAIFKETSSERRCVGESRGRENSAALFKSPHYEAIAAPLCLPLSKFPNNGAALTTRAVSPRPRRNKRLQPLTLSLRIDYDSRRESRLLCD